MQVKLMLDPTLEMLSLGVEDDNCFLDMIESTFDFLMRKVINKSTDLSTVYSIVRAIL